MRWTGVVVSPGGIVVPPLRSSRRRSGSSAAGHASGARRRGRGLHGGVYVGSGSRNCRRRRRQDGGVAAIAGPWKPSPDTVTTDSRHVGVDGIGRCFVRSFPLRRTARLLLAQNRSIRVVASGGELRGCF